MKIAQSPSDAHAPEPSRLPRLRSQIFAAVGAWAIAILLGCAAMIRYETAPGDMHPPQAPASTSDLALDPLRPTLVMFIHPKCPCSRASLTELARIIEAHPDAATTQIRFVIPADAQGDWSNTPLSRQAAAIPGANLLLDIDGALATRFGAETSGTLLVFSTDGTALFSGGITPSRGHEGDSQGRQSVIDILTHRRTTSTTSPVFGCELGTPCAECPH